ncbi:MAG: nucleotidyl transferase AbiEii/AbiGii toxin family protein [Xanthomonadaceae bacterium]|jgi:hypothetical protein|nr:nucleotidyl transferase AbiEii/AbiGii toxin family protein [Xanthomonadaceae bacterium]
MIRLLNKLKESFRSSLPEGYPQSYLANGARRKGIFGPSSKHYPHAFRPSEPDFRNEQDREQWHAARTSVMVHVLALIATSPWRDYLVLCGSVPMRTWVGDRARVPSDMDWMVLPIEIKSSSRKAKALFDSIVALIAANRTIGRIKIDWRRMVRDRIWTHERADGVRLVFPWRVGDLPEGILQMDFVFGEMLWESPVSTRIALSRSSPEVRLMTVTPELSLAWKLMWLESDMYPQGKNLYDATLLAEYVRLSPQLLDTVMRNGQESEQYLRYGVDPRRWLVNWDNFRQECPQVLGGRDSWMQRLTVAIAPTVQALPGPS